MKKCKEANCNGVCYAKEYCMRHYAQIRKYGHILERARGDPNKFIFCDDVCKIELCNIKREIIGYAIIDSDDYYKIKHIKWCAHGRKKKNQYVAGRINGTYVFLHRMLFGVGKDKFIDHKNGDGFDNRRSNLRLATKSENTKNKKKQHIINGKRTTSKYKGVSWNKRERIWYSFITVDCKSIYLGRFKNEIDAAKAYNKAAKIYFDEYALLNEI
jgi:hypothetical protein